jgi:hypothetical protein
MDVRISQNAGTQIEAIKKYIYTVVSTIFYLIIGAGLEQSVQQIGYGFDGPGFDFWQRQGISLFSEKSRMALGPTKRSGAIDTGFFPKGKPARTYS